MRSASALAVVAGANVCGFALTALLKSEVVTDLVGVGSIGVSALLLHLQRPPGASARAAVTTAAIVLWSAKLAVFLAWRALTVGDARLAAMLPPPGASWAEYPERLLSLAGFWVAQCVWGSVMLTPQVALGAVPVAPRVGAAALVLAGVGLVLETVADVHKAVCKASGHELCTGGLYAIVQYPNYSGEVVFWAGLGLYYAVGVWRAARGRRARVLLAFLPVALVALLLIKASGIPLTEAARRRRLAASAAYAAYQARVPSWLVPGVF